MRFPCPVCGNEDGVQVVLTRDEQGEPPWTAQLNYLEIGGDTCCVLSAEQAEAILYTAGREPFDYEDEYLGEPDY